MSSYHQLLKIYLLLVFILKVISKLIEPEYNNGKVQDPNLDKSYLDKTGQIYIIYPRDINYI